MSTQSLQKSSRSYKYLIGGVVALLLFIVSLLVSAYIYSAWLLNPVSSAQASNALERFDGSYLLTISDADMVGTAYADDVLMQIPNDRDTLTIFDLPLDDSSPVGQEELFVSNSVTSWPQVMAISPEGARAYIVETASEIADDVDVYPNLQANPPTGRSLTVVDLEANTTQVYDVMDNPLHIGLHPQERFVAIGGTQANAQLALLPIDTLADASTYQFFSIENRHGEPAREVTSVSWHPSGDYLAIGVDRSELLFYSITYTETNIISLQPFGERLQLGNTISYGEFTADGEYYLTTEINWGAVPGALGYAFNPRGEMIAIRFDDSELANHEIASRVEVGQSPEGFAISPDNQLIVTVDMRRTYLPDALSFIPGTNLNSLSLLTFDTESGQLSLVDQYGFEGVLPEHATFDADGDALAVVIYNEREMPMNPGYIEFWHVLVDEDTPSLERTTTTIPVTRGAHSIIAIP